MKKYEATILITPLAEKSEAEGLLKKIADFINEKGGIADRSQAVKIKLAYLIEKNKEAFLGTISFSESSEKIKEIKEKIKSEKDVLRSIIVAKKEESAKKIKPARSKNFKKEQDKKVDIEKIDQKIDEILL